MTGNAGDATPATGTRNDRSGPAVARLYQRLLAAIFLVAWASLGVQVDVLIGSRGLLPAAPFLAAAQAHGLAFADLPTVFWFGSADWALHAGIWVGAAASAAALLGRWPRLCIAIATVLYLSYATVCRTFLSFQWDNLLIESGVLAVLLPTDRPARWVHVLFRVLLFKLYFESGIAKWQSYLGDWQDGSAMQLYYETAPLPTWIAWYAHDLPAGWHRVESWAVLVIELVLPVLIFGPRTLKLVCLLIFTVFQVINLATANYGFFVYLTLALHVFLLADRDIERLAAWARLRPRSASPAPFPTPRPAWRRHVRIAGAAAAIAISLSLSIAGALAAFADLSPAGRDVIEPLQSAAAPWRAVNTYHLFGHITRERIEPEFQVESGEGWRAVDLRHKPGDVLRAPDIVAPHQPRVDFQLWFYGLGFQRGAPPYVTALLQRLCTDPAVVQPLFTEPLPAAPTAVRIVFWRYRFSPADEPIAWWTREEIGASRPIACAGPGSS